MYEFPVIETIDDVLPHVQGRRDIIVKESDNPVPHVVMCYRLHEHDTFEDSPSGRMRRECRGILFSSKTGKVLSRPFHKFFNLGETTETLAENIDTTKPHVIQPKMDGSMVRPIWTGLTMLWATKFGFTGHSEMARKCFSCAPFSQRQARLAWIKDMTSDDFTPIFEYVGPENQVVIKYDHSEIIFLALRNNRTGEYVDPPSPYPGLTVPDICSLKRSLKGWASAVAGQTGIEGFVLAFDDGFRVKVKTAEYVRIHKIKHQFNQDRHVAMAVLEERLDDILSVLPEEMREDIVFRGDVFLDVYWKGLRGILHNCLKIRSLADQGYYGDNPRKMVALKVVPTVPKENKQFIFRALSIPDEKVVLEDLRKAFDVYAQKEMHTDKRYARFIEWCGEVNRWCLPEVPEGQNSNGGT